MASSPREAYAASLSPSEILARDKEGFPRKSCITFGEVVSTFSRYGSVASKRHGGIYISKSLKIPNRFSTISDNTKLREGESRCSPRSSVRTLRSRTPSPCSSTRPRSLPVTPRSSTARRRPEAERDAYAPGDLEEVAYREPLVTSSFNRGNPGGTASTAVTPGHGGVTVTGAGTGGSSGRHAAKAKFSTPCLSCGNVLSTEVHDGVKRAARRESGDFPSPHSPQACYAAQPMSRSWPSHPSREERNWSADYASKGNPRVASFVRLNGFLLRTHITSLLSALAEDGWLEAWEKDRLCSHAREESPWSQAFLRIYSRFMETEDVGSFVAALKAQAA